jgi:hypothetical protein
MADDDELAKAIAQVREAIERARGYADFFDFAPDRDIAEVGAVESLAESLASDGTAFFTGLQSRGRGNDPPDCEALDSAAQRIAIEVTEMVSADAIRASKAEGAPYWQEWDKQTFLSRLTDRMLAKDARYPKLKGGPYPGGYFVVVYTDEALLSPDFVRAALEGQEFRVQHISGAFLLLSYRAGTYPYFELKLRPANPVQLGIQGEP